MLKHLLLTISVLVIVSLVVFAESGFDDEGNVNDPAVNDRANACYDGGTLEGRCETELDWQAGWYLIRYEFGLLSREEVPGWVVWVLPPEFVPEELAEIATSPSAPTTNCQQYFAAGFYVDFGSGNFLLRGHVAYVGDPTCTTPNATHWTDIVYAPGGVNALAICNANGTYSSTSLLYGDVYSCNA